MIKMLLGATSGLALLSATPTPAVAQHSGHGGMTMPMPAKKKPAARKPAPKKQVVAKKPAARKAPVRAASKPRPKPAPARVAAPAPPPAPPPAAIDHSTMDHGQMNHAPAPVSSAPAVPVPVDHSQMNHAPAPATSASTVDHAAMGHGTTGQGEGGHGEGGHGAMRGALGPYSANREASGTAWQPDSAEHKGWMMRSGDWDIMVHGNLDLIADTQSGPRGDDKIFPAGMLMGMATRQFANGNALQFRGMVSPDPLMGKSGYPLLLASGETANGRDRLIDRQHPHDFFMELSGSYSVKLAERTSAFVYAGLPGEPAFGPPPFMHRQSISASPEAPITHHWLDSTHITFGVVTAGLVLDRIKIEASRFNGREPDQKRWNIETAPLDSTAVRLSWNPTGNLSLQGSWAHLEEPEQLEPGIDQKRLSASATYTRPMAQGWWSTSLAWGRKSLLGESYDAVALESSVKWNDWTVFGRGEITENNELIEEHDGDEEGEGHHGEAFTVGKVSLGVVRDFRIAEHLALGIGGLYSLNFVPKGLRDEYGGRNPHGAMGFVRLKIQ